MVSTLTDSDGLVSSVLTEYLINGSITYTNDCSDATGNIICEAPYQINITSPYDGSIISLNATGNTTDSISASIESMMQLSNQLHTDYVFTYGIGLYKMVKDAQIDNVNLLRNDGGDTQCVVGGTLGGRFRCLIAFNTSGIPSDAIVNSAYMWLRFVAPTSSDNYMINRLMSNWTEGNQVTTNEGNNLAGVTWNYSTVNNTLSQNWFEYSNGKATFNKTTNVEGQGDIFINNISSITINNPLSNDQFYQIGGLNNNFSQLVQGWVNLSFNWSYGIMISNSSALTQSDAIYSSEYTSYQFTPRLYVNWTANLTEYVRPMNIISPNSFFYITANYTNGDKFGSSPIYGGRQYFYSGNLRVNRLSFAFAGLTNNNSKVDILSNGDVDVNNKSVAYYANGTLAAQLNPGGVNGYNSKPIDLNHDGKDEICVTAAQGNPPSCYYRNGTLVWRGIANNYDTIYTYDFNGDGYLDVAFGSESSSPTGTGNITIYNGSTTRTVLYTLGNFSGSRGAGNASATWEMMAENITGINEFAFTYGETAGIASRGIAVYNASNMSKLIYIANKTAGSGTGAYALAPIDRNRVGYYNSWMFTANTGVYVANDSMNGIVAAILTVPTGDIRELKTGDLDGDGFKNDFVIANIYNVTAYKFNNDNSTTKLWDFVNPLLVFNSTADLQLAQIENIIVKDVFGRGRSDVIVGSSSANIFIIDGKTGKLLSWLDAGFNQTGMLETTTVPYGMNPLMDIGFNSTDNASMLGFATNRLTSSKAVGRGYLYAFQLNPCTINIPKGSGFLAAMTWNDTLNSWYYANTTGMAAGTYTYMIYCNGNFSGYGTSSLDGTLVINNPASMFAFTVYTLGGGGNSTNSMSTSLGNSTEAYYFNSSSMYGSLLKPCASADGTSNCQISMVKNPIYRISNTGTVDLTGLYMKLTGAAGSGIKVCANSSGTAGVTGAVATCDLSSSKGNLNESNWIRLAAAVPQTQNLNVTIYANFTAVQGGVYSTVNSINSTNT
jgi:hypothetical protein